MAIEFDSNRRCRLALHVMSILCAGIVAVPASSVRAQEISLNAFGDLNYGYRFGKPASASAAE